MNALEAYGEWMKYNSRSVYDCTMAEPEFKAPEGTVITQSNDEKRLYIHLQNYPFGRLFMENLADKIYYAQFLSDGSEIKYTPEGENGTVLFNLPTIPPKGISPVIEVFLK